MRNGKIWKNNYSTNKETKTITLAVTNTKAN